MERSAPTVVEFEVWPEPLPAPDYLASHDACLVKAGDSLEQPPPLQWLANQRKAYADALKKQRVDILVAPFQIQGYGLERTERAIMSADLAYHLDPAARVADPFLTARALGEGARRYEPSEVVQLARAVGARTAVVGYVGHDRQHRMTVTIQVLDASDTSTSDAGVNAVQRDWRGVSFTEFDPPFVVFHRMLPAVLESLSLPIAEQPRERSPVAFPEHASVSLADVASDANPLGASLGLSLLGAMAASADERSRERLFERALVASWHFDAPSADTTFLRAYALLNLEHRPAALALINGAEGAEYATLRALLNGDLPAAAAAVSKVRNPLKRLMLAVHVDDLRYEYQREDLPAATDAESTFADDAGAWLALAASRSADADRWRVDESAVLKALLDEVHPVAGLGVQSVLGGSLVVGAPTDDVTVDIATMRHVARFVQSTDPPLCCAADSAAATAWDLVSLIEGRTESRVGKYLYLTTVVRGAPERAGDAIERYRSVFDGHPLFALAQADRASALREQATGDTLQRLQSEVHEHARVAAASAGGQSYTAVKGVRALGVPGPEGRRYVDGYGFDYPRRSWWPNPLMQLMGVDYTHEFDAEALPYARTDLSALPYIGPTTTEREKAFVVAQLESRFVGHPSRAAVLRSVTPPRPSSGDPLADAKAAVDESPADWSVRNSHGVKLIEEHGRWEEAAKLLIAHPYFHSESPPQPVNVSNDAYEVGSVFYWGGHQDLAIPFYEVAVRLGTGAESDITSEIRLNILAGRYREATVGSYARAQRYPSAYAFRDFLSFLHAFGYGEEAWDGFSQIGSSFDNPQIWLSALVGHRIEGKEESEIRAWLKQPGVRDAQFRGSLFAPRYAVLVNASDHETPEDLGALVAEIEGPPTGRVSGPGQHEEPNPNSPTRTYPVNRSLYAMLQAMPEENIGTPVKSHLVYFGSAYAALRHGRFDVAVDEFAAMANHYPIEEPRYSYALPYFAWAAAKTGDAGGLEKFLSGLPGKEPVFDRNLALAFLHAARKDVVGARELLDKALRSHPFTEYRPVLIEYQYAEACEWLYQETGDKAFIDALLAWVVSQQIVQPTQAWPYAMEYTYARTPERKLRALAMTLYLDPKSPRIREASPKERADAQAWGAAHNPFLQEDNPPGGGPTARASIAPLPREG